MYQNFVVKDREINFFRNFQSKFNQTLLFISTMLIMRQMIAIVRTLNRNANRDNDIHETLVCITNGARKN